MTKLLLNWAPTVTGSGGDYWSEAEVEGFGTVGVHYSARNRWDFWVRHEGSQGWPWEKLGSAPSSVLNLHQAKQHMEETYLPPMIRLLLETKQNPRRSRRNPNFLLDWKVHEHGCGHTVYAAEIEGAGKLYMEIFPSRRLYCAYFWPDGAEISNRQVDVPAGLDTLYARLRWVEDNLIPPVYRMLLETKENPHRPRHFTPSYEADSSEDYEQKVRQGKKRLLHVQIHGGRKATAGKERDIPRLQPATKTRLIERTPPWGARTQSVMAHERAVERQVASSGQEDRLEQTIRQAIEAYRKSQPAGSTGFAVPSSVEPLLNSGMPYRPADILVSRARNAFFPAIGTPVIREISRPTIGSLVVYALKAPLVVRPTDNQLVVAVPGFRQEKVIVGFYAVEPNVRSTGLGVRTSLLGSKEIQEIAQRYRESLKAEGEEYRREVHDPEVIRRLMARLSERIRPYAKRPSVQAAIVTRFKGKEEVIPFPIGEHSTIEASQDGKSRIDYRSLRNVDLNSLPPLLASLSLRRKRKGRRLKVL